MADETEFRIPWYTLDADYNSIGTEGFWKQVTLPSGARTAYVGRYGKWNWCEWRPDNAIVRMSAEGLSFILPEKYRVSPGPGSVTIRQWLYKERAERVHMRFREGHHYVICLDREPVNQWLNRAGEPSCDLDTELQHVLAIVEICPTYSVVGENTSPALPLTTENLDLYREERFDGGASAYKLEFSVMRSQGAGFESETTKGRSPASPELVQKLIYALNTCQWKPEDQSHPFDEPPVVRSVIGYRDSKGRLATGLIEYFSGRWFLTLPGRRYYSTSFPPLLYEVESEVVGACADKANDAIPVTMESIDVRN